MYSENRLLEVQDPDGNQYTIKLEQDSITIGRSNENDIVLPNPGKTISRQHCILECEEKFWWIVDDLSANGTFVQQRNSDTRIDVRDSGRLQLSNGDVILILGKFLEGDEPVFWRLTFRDSDETKPDSRFGAPAYLEYSLSKQKLFRVNGRERQEVLLRPQERTLIHYMVGRNQTNNNQPIVCAYTELIEAIWGDRFGHTNNDVTRLVWGVRQKVESDSGEPDVLNIKVQELGTNVHFTEDTTHGIREVKNNLGGIYYASASEVVKECSIKPLPLGRTAGKFVTPYKPPVISGDECPRFKNKIKVNVSEFRNGNYPITRKLFVIIKSNEQRKQQAGEAYANLLLTAQGQELLEKAGYASLNHTPVQ